MLREVAKKILQIVNSGLCDELFDIFSSSFNIGDVSVRRVVDGFFDGFMHVYIIPISLNFTIFVN